jgi:hypothetical protein
MCNLRPICLVQIAMLALTIGSINTRAASVETYKITSGRFGGCCAIWGGWSYEPPSAAQTFVELTQDAEANTAQMRILDLLLLDEYAYWPLDFFGLEPPFAHGTIDGGTIHFHNEHVEPDPPWDDPSDEFFGRLDYTVTVEQEQFQMTGSFVSNTCFDCYSNFTHLGIQGRLVVDSIPGDLNEDGQLDISDLEILSDYRDYPEYLARWVKDARRTWAGDANLDSEFNSSDMVQVFVTGKYETGEDASWAEGDWNGDGIFNSSDMVRAFVDGGYEKGLRMDAAAVPEPTSVLLLAAGLMGVAIVQQRRRS